MAKKQPPLKIIPLGGLDGIGKNMTVFEYGNDMVLLDAGLMFPDDEQPGIDLVLPDSGDFPGTVQKVTLVEGATTGTFRSVLENECLSRCDPVLLRIEVR